MEEYAISTNVKIFGASLSSLSSLCLCQSSGMVLCLVGVSCQVTNMTEHNEYVSSLHAWETERQRQQVEFTVTEDDPDADLRLPSAQVHEKTRILCCLEL